MASTDEDARRPDHGFTLIEILIVVVTIGLIAAAIATTITVVLRNAPPTEVRVDDARSVQGLVTWLPQDVDAAPPDGFNRDHAYWPCGGTAPSVSFNVLTAEWTEEKSSSHNFAASYRYELVGSAWSMARYTCDDGGVGPMGTARRTNLTSDLPRWIAGAPPARVEMCRSQVSAGGSCPTADVIPVGDTSPSDVQSLKLLITRLDGVEATIDAAPKNPDQDLADDPNATTNQPPERAQLNYTLPMFAGDTVTIDLGATHGATDPDGDPISAAIDSTEPMPTGISAVTSDPLNLTVTADAGLTPGVISPYIVTIISDNKAGWTDATVTVEILPEPNLPPTVSPSNYHLQLEAGDTVVLPLDTTHNVADPNGDPMTVTVIGYPNAKVNPPQPNSPDPLDLEIRAPGGATVGVDPTPISLEISDGNGGVTPATITVEIIPTVTNQSPTASQSNISVDMYANDTLDLDLAVSHGVNDADGDPLSIVSATGPTGAATTLHGALDVTIATDPGLPIGPLGTVNMQVDDPYGASINVVVEIRIVPTPPPPSDCVLGTLTASPSPVDRQGGGTNAHPLREDVTITVTYTGTCDGLALTYDTGDTSGLGIGTGRIFPPGSPSSVVIVGKPNGGTEKWTPATHTLTATTTSAVSPNSISTTLTVT